MADQIIDDYKSSLGDLTFNSKPHINMLTMIAEENTVHAGAIVKAIEQHLQQVQPTHMLPVMYLIDSIVKNIQQGSYRELFAKNLVKTFCGVFEKVDEKTRQAMFKLRQTWPAIFSNSKLYSLDMGVQQLDPAWPVTATTPEAKPKDIHVNPKFLKQRQDEELARKKKAAEEAAAAKKASQASSAVEEAKQKEIAAHALMQQQLFEKQQELLRLQQQKLEMELKEAKARIDQQKRELELKEQQLQLEAEMKAKAEKEEADKILKAKQEQERAAALKREQEKAEALKKQLEARAMLIKQKAAANKKEADIKASFKSAPKVDMSAKDPRLARDPRLQDPRSADPRAADPRMTDPRLLAKQERPLPSPAQGAKVATPSTRLEDDEEMETSCELSQSQESTSKDKPASRSSRSSKKDQQKKSSSSKEPSKTPEKSGSDSRKSSFSRKSRSSRSYRAKRESESPEDVETADAKRSRSRSPQPDATVEKPKDERGAGKDRRRSNRRSDGKRSSGKDKDTEEPPAKMSKAEKGDDKENKKLPEDLAALFGNEDQDYRSLPPIPKLNTAAAAAAASSSSSLVSPSPNSAGWAQFKASRPEEFPFSQPRPSMDVDMRSPPVGGNLMASPPLTSPNSRLYYIHGATETSTLPPVIPPPDRLGAARFASGSLLSPEQENIVIPKPMLLDSAEGILKEAQMQLEAGKLSHDQHQELLKQLDQLFKLQSLKHHLRQNEVDEQFVAAQKAFDDHTSKIRETIAEMGDKNEREPRDRRADMSAQSPLFDDPRDNRRRQGSPSRKGYGSRGDRERERGNRPDRPDRPDRADRGDRPDRGDRAERNRGPMREFNRRNSVFSKLGSQRDEEEDRPLWQMPPGQLSLPYDMTENYVPAHDPRWYSPSDGHEVTHEVVLNHKSWEVPYLNKARPIRISGEKMIIRANPYTREVTINDQMFYRIGEPMRNIMLQGRSYSISYRGPLKKIWIANFMYEIASDAPPTKILLGESEHDLRIDSVDNTVIVDGHIICGYGEKVDTVLIAGKRFEIRFAPPARQILIDGSLCELDFSTKYPCIFIKGKPHGIRFDGPPRQIFINGRPWAVNVDRPRKARLESKRVHIIGLGGPGHEVIIDGKWHEVKFGETEKYIQMGHRKISIKLTGPPPEVKILGELVTDPLIIDKLTNGYRIDPSSAIDTTVQLDHRNNKNFNQQESNEFGFSNQFGGNMHPQERFGNPGMRPHFNDQRGMRPDNHFNQGRFRRDGPRGARMPFNMGFNNDQRFPGPNNMQFGPQGPMQFEPRMNQFPPMNDNMGPNGPNNFPQGPNAPNNFPQGPNGPNNFPQGPNGPNNFPQGPNGPNNFPQGPNGPNNFPQGPPGPPPMPPLPFQGPPMQNNFNEGMGAPPMMNQPMQNQVNVNDLFSKLLQFGIINQNEDSQGSPQKVDEMPQQPPQHGNNMMNPMNPQQQQQGPPGPDKPNPVLQLLNSVVRKEPPKKKEEVFEPVPDLTELAPEKLKTEYNGIVQKLYSGIQCSSCGVRFIAEDTAKYREHLDWHFRQNKKDKDEVKVTKFRRWYYTMLEWIQFEEFSADDDRAQSAYFERIAQAQVPQESGTDTPPVKEEETITSCPVAGDEADDVCDVCGDPFEQFWSEESEAWHLKDAIRADGKTYHPVCYEDFRETSMMETPTPDQERSNPLRNITGEAPQNEQKNTEEKGDEAVSSSQDDSSKKMETEAVASSESASEAREVASTSPKPSTPVPEAEKAPSPKPKAPTPVKLFETDETSRSSIPATEDSNTQPAVSAGDSAVRSPSVELTIHPEGDVTPEEEMISEVPASVIAAEREQEAEVAQNTEDSAEQETGDSEPQAEPEADQMSQEVDDDPDLMVSIEPLESPKTPLQDEPMSPPGSPLARQIHSTSPIVTRLSMLNKEVLTTNPMALVQQRLNPDLSEGPSSARASPITTQEPPVPGTTSAPASAKTSPAAQVKSEENVEDMGQPISSVLGVFSRRW